MQASSLVAKNIEFSYPDTVFQFPDIEIASGQSCALVGPSGSGKTTLLHLIAGLLSPTAGRIEIAGQDIVNMSQSQRDQFRGQHMGIVLQRLHLMSALTVSQNLQLAQKLAGNTGAEPTELLAELDMADKAHSKPDELSVGQAQRVAIARAVIHQPSLILADEPTSSLDDANAERVLSILQKQAAKCNAALLVITHDARVRGQLDHCIEMPAQTNTQEAAA
ncbi:MAG: ABC transporter ATP-binding protein [Gammaproteobacteria bacterium]|nr:ABC transporter ATP-binding protein [Gammaproteobacteria bacterium]